jgi:bacterioferritin-associated ferredoxin
MLVCHCQAVNETRIREVIADGAQDEFDVADMCGAGGGCGGCVPVVTALLAKYSCAPACRASSPEPIDCAGCELRAVASAPRSEPARAGRL